MVPTALDAIGVEQPEALRGVTQAPIEGVSLVSTFDNTKAPETRVTQYFEMFGHRSLYHDDWRAVCPWPGTSFIESGKTFGTPLTADMLTELDEKGWETLQPRGRTSPRQIIRSQRERSPNFDDRHVVRRGRQVQRTSDRQPWIAAGSRGASANRRKPEPLRALSSTQSIPAGAAPQILNKPFSINAEVEIPPAGAEEVC